MNENLDTKEFTVRAISLKASFPSSEVKEAVIVGGDFQFVLKPQSYRNVPLRFNSTIEIVLPNLGCNFDL